MGKNSKPRSYSAVERAEAVVLAQKLGPAKASKELGIPTGTLSCWVSMSRRGPIRANEKLPPGIEGPGSGGRSREGEAENTETGRTEPGRQRGDDSEGSAASKQPGRRKIAKQYTPSQRAEILEYASEHGVTAAQEKFGVSRYSVYEWRRRAALAAEGEGPSPTSGPDPAEIETQRDREILDEWRRNPGLGPSQVRNQLRRKGVRVAVGTVRKVMEAAGYRPPKVSRRGHEERFEAVRPNQLWHLDFLQRYVNRTSTFTLILLDDFSRFVVGHGVDDAERAGLVIETFEQAVARHGRPEMVLHDRGSAFWSWRGISRFTALLTEMGIDQVAAEHKEWNGKLEVFNANLQKELFTVHHFYDTAEMKRRLTSHLHWYNHRRTSHALGGLLVPADRFHGRVDEVMARIEAGAASEVALDALAVRDRVLELFKVTSVDGHPQVWLMGQRLWPTK